MIEYSSEGLKLLYTKLLKHRDELLKMFENLNQINGFSEDCSTSKLHKLIAFLFKISSNASDENVCIMYHIVYLKMKLVLKLTIFS